MLKRNLSVLFLGAISFFVACGENITKKVQGPGGGPGGSGGGGGGAANPGLTLNCSYQYSYATVSFQSQSMTAVLNIINGPQVQMNCANGTTFGSGYQCQDTATGGNEWIVILLQNGTQWYAYVYEDGMFITAMNCQ